MIKHRNINKITVSILFFCMLLIPGCSAGSKKTNSPQTEQKNISSEASKNQSENNQTTQQTTTSETKITVTPPAGWEPVEGTTALLQYLNNGSSFIVTADNIPSTVKTPDAYIDFVKEQFTGAFDEVKFADAESVTIAGLEGRKLMFTCKVSGFQMQYAVYYAFKNDKAYTFTCGTLSDQFKTLSGDYEAFISSVKFK